MPSWLTQMYCCACSDAAQQTNDSMNKYLVIFITSNQINQYASVNTTFV